MPMIISQKTMHMGTREGLSAVINTLRSQVDGDGHQHFAISPPPDTLPSMSSQSVSSFFMFINFSFDPARVEAVTGCKTSLLVGLGLLNPTIRAERR